MITIGTFNIRYPNPDDGKNYFPHRLPGIIQKIQTEKPDLIGFQELMMTQLEPLSAALSEYSYIGYSSCVDPAEASDRIFFRKDSFECLKWDQFWLSPTPDVPGSCYEHQSICPRICTWGRFMHKQTGKEMIVINTHLDHEQEYAREHGLTQLFETFEPMVSAEDIPVFIMGDFNLTPAEAPYRLIKQFHYIDLTEGLEPTFHAFGQCDPIKIDYVLSRKPITYTRERWHQCIDGLYLSDHDPVMIHIDETSL